MPVKKTTYSCGVCGIEYQTLAEAEKCEANVAVLEFEPGDIVFCKSGFGWYDGDKAWVSNPDVDPRRGKCPNGDSNCFSECCTYKFYYVVTAIDLRDWGGRIDHMARYHLRTLAMSGDKGHAGGHTSEDHYKVVRAPKPPKVVKEQGRALIGWKADYLL
ncbi:hypothetical protein LCGC14_2342600 [marine sediment metagenome]|uniref:Uncharacterized protein n=1 Tax=marine sediment metagenome TaxID=412755 RepID=A0A0F9CCC9_9ZZZZ